MTVAPPVRRKRRDITGITGIGVSGFKSLVGRVDVEIRPFTILAGPNSSGKSSVMQAVLLLKQTLEASYDPGPLRLDGPNVEFTAADQLFSRLGPRKTARSDDFVVGIEVAGNDYLEIHFSKKTKGIFDVVAMIAKSDGDETLLAPGMRAQRILAELPEATRELFATYARLERRAEPQVAVQRNRCFLEVAFEPGDESRVRAFVPRISLAGDVDPHIREIIHIPGLRGNPERLYPVTAVGATFPGPFPTYVASVIHRWQTNGAEGTLRNLGQDLLKLGLTWKVRAEPVSDTQVELQVGRLPQAGQGGAWDLVNIADVGVGVSQTLPVLVAARVARPGQIIYVEQPEIHLHPRAQYLMAEVLVGAVRRGVRLIIETHSDLLLLGLQTQVARMRIPREMVKLHWFARTADGITHVTSAEVDASGSFGEWPEDFGEVQMSAETKYLDAAQERLPLDGA